MWTSKVVFATRRRSPWKMRRGVEAFLASDRRSKEEVGMCDNCKLAAEAAADSMKVPYVDPVSATKKDWHASYSVISNRLQ